jgi:hypothetical protein
MEDHQSAANGPSSTALASYVPALTGHARGSHGRAAERVAPDHKTHATDYSRFTPHVVFWRMAGCRGRLNGALENNPFGWLTQKTQNVMVSLLTQYYTGLLAK